jgi:hypothetical protein
MPMKTQILTGTAAAALVSAALAPSAHAQSADALIDKLVDKGVLTLKEARELRDEADKNFTTAYSVKSGMPEWVTSLRLNGDLRGRFEGFYADNPAFVDRNRFRYRLRAGFTAVLKDQFEIGFRLTSSENASGTAGGDPISGNTTLTDNGSKKGIFIDMAYAKWTPINNATWSAAFTAGKMENPFILSEMVFDADYTPEGLAQQLVYNINDRNALKLNLGEFAVKEVGGSSQDAYLLGAQLRWDAAWTTRIQSSVGITALALTGGDSLVSSAVPNQNRGNTRNKDGALVESYNPFVADASITYMLEKFPLYAASFPIRIAGEYMDNPAAARDHQAYAVGVMFGKSGKKGLWDVSYKYKELQADSWYEELVDSDFGAFYETAPLGGTAGYGAGTNLRGHVMKASYSPFDSMTVSVTWFLAELINKSPLTSDSAMNRLQVDASWKF